MVMVWQILIYFSNILLIYNTCGILYVSVEQICIQLGEQERVELCSIDKNPSVSLVFIE